MIFTKPKSLEEVHDLLDGYNKPLIMGCGTCSADCHTGGEKEVAAMKEHLATLGKGAVAGEIVETLCNVERVRRALKAKADVIEGADAILVLSCGIAVQVVAEFVDKPVLPGLDTIFAGKLERLGQYKEMCAMCGQCVVAQYGGICPVSRCPKGMLNGPCGGTREGSCEVDEEMDCVWVSIYERMKVLGVEGSLSLVAGPKDNAEWAHPRRVSTGTAILEGKW